jgi:hypothetical protein
MSGRVIAVTSVGAISGSRAAAAALACAGSDPDRSGLLIDVGGRSPRPTLIASSGARELEERLAVHSPSLRAASRGQTCHLAVDADGGYETIRTVLPLVRDSVAVLHVPPGSCRDLLDVGFGISGVLLCADLAFDRSLTALVVGELRERDLRVRVLKRPLPWVSARRALFGVLPENAPGGLPIRLSQSLLESQISAAPACYVGEDDEEIDSERTAQQQWRSGASPGRRRGLRTDEQRQARG